VRANSKITKDIIKALNFPNNATIGGVIRDGVGYIPLGDFRIQADDKVLVSCLADAVTKIEKYFD
jgi:trk system potassium uptake protein TrkA